MLATRMLPELERQTDAQYRKVKSEQAKNQKREGGKFKPAEKDTVKQAKKVLTARPSPTSAHKAGEMFGVSGSTVQKAKRIPRNSARPLCAMGRTRGRCFWTSRRGSGNWRIRNRKNRCQEIKPRVG